MSKTSSRVAASTTRTRRHTGISLDPQLPTPNSQSVLLANSQRDPSAAIGSWRSASASGGWELRSFPACYKVMPELPDILLYLHALRTHVVGHRVEAVRLASPFLLRSIDPPLTSIEGRTIVDPHRLGKR